MNYRLPSWFKLIIIMSLLLTSVSLSQNDTVKIATYNLLKFSSSDGARTPFFRTVVHTINPDILIVQEMENSGGHSLFLNNVMNMYQSGLYATVPFNDGPDMDNSIFYKPAKFAFVGAYYIPTALRNIAEYTLQHIASGEQIRIYSLHLKASSSTDDENKRLAEVTILRDHLNSLPPGTNFIVGGDYNIYRSTEPAFQKLIGSEANNIGRCYDPQNAVGVWTSNIAFKNIHTQSPRVRSFGGGVTGGLDDRFDILLHSSSLSDRIITSSYTPYGNDGNHFNDSINRLPNTAVPDSVANGLHYASDHLPVFAKYIFQSGAGSITLSGTLTDFGSVNVGGFSLEQSYSVSATGLTGNLLITSPTGFQISTTSGSGFTNSISLPHTGGSISTRPIYVRFAPASPGAFSGYINHSSNGANTPLLFVSGTANSLTTIAAWDFYNQSSPATFPATTWNGNLSSSNLVTRGPGASASTGSHSFRTQGFQNNGISTANTDYFQVTIGPSSGYRVSLSTIDARFSGTESFVGTGGVSHQFAYSLDGTQFTLIGSPSVLTGTVPLNMPQVNLSGISALQNVPPGTTIMMRYYASGQTTTGGWGFYSNTVAGTNGLAFGGSVTQILPTINVSNTSIPDFGKIEIGNVSATKSFQVSGVDLTGDISLNAPTGFEISLSEGSGFGSLLVLNQSGGSVPQTTIYLRFKPTAEQYYSVDITVTSTGATTKNISVSGTGLAIEPTIQASGLSFSSVGLNSLTFSWTNGDGANRLVVARSGSAVNTHPSDGLTYSANSVFGSGAEIGSGNFVVYSGSGNSVSVTGLSANTVYHFNVYENRGTGISTNYFTSPPASANRLTQSVIWKEDFETGSKASYAVATVTCTKGSWAMEEGLIGNLANDRKIGAQSVRMRNANGYISMEFNKSNGAGIVTVNHAKYGTDGNSSWKLQYSTNSGTNWFDIGSTYTATDTVLQIQQIQVNKSGEIRIRIVHTTGGSSNRLNIDDIIIADYDKVYEGSDNISGVFGNVTVSKPGTVVTLNGNLTVNGDLTLNSGTSLNIGSYTLTVFGNIIDNGGILTGGTNSSLVINGSGESAFLSDITLGNLTLNRIGGLNLNGNVTINSLLTLTSGKVFTDENILTISPSGSIARTNGYVIGNLKKHIPTGPVTRNFELGDASNYTPVSINFGNVTGAGYLAVSVVPGLHPEISNAGFIENKILNKYYSVTNEGIQFDNSLLTLNYAAGDIPSGADWNKFVIRKFDNDIWLSTVVGNRTPTSIQASGITSFSDFAVGELIIITRSISGNTGVGGTTLDYTDNGPKTAISDTNGDYSFSVSYNWSGTVTPSKTGYTFNPANKNYNNVLTNQIDQNYIASAITFTISGNAGVAGATLSYEDGEPKTATVDGSGNYSFAVSYNWSGTVTPSLTGFTFTPSSRNYTDVVEDKTNQDYVAVSSGTTMITVTMNSGWNLVSVPVIAEDNNASVLFPGAASGTIYSFLTGSYTQPGSLETGVGYWAYYLTGGTNSIIGTPITTTSVTVSTGNRWALIGSVSTTVPVSALSSNPPGAIVSGTLYGFNGSGYFKPTQIESGKSYWVYVNAPCTLTINSGSLKSNGVDNKITDN